MISPITPDDIPSAKSGAIPEEVIKCFNTAIALAFNNGRATVKQEDVVKAILASNILLDNQPLERWEIFERGWLNVEDMYRAAGWKVTYDKPGYNENYPATFEFKRERG